MTLRNANTATPESIQKLAELNLNQAIKIKNIQSRLDSAEKLLDEAHDMLKREHKYDCNHECNPKTCELQGFFEKFQAFKGEK